MPLFGRRYSYAAAGVGAATILWRSPPAISPAPLPAEAQLDTALSAYIDYFAATAGELRKFFAAVPSAPDKSGPVAEAHEIQIGRILALLAAPNTSRNRMAAGAWLTFVVTAAKEAAGNPGMSRDEVLDVCKLALTAVIKTGGE